MKSEERTARSEERERLQAPRPGSAAFEAHRARLAPEPSLFALRPSLVGATLAIFLVSLAIYGASAVALGRTASPEESYFDRLADSFLHGRLYLVAPPSNHDLTKHAGHWYVPFPPLPALMLVPWVAAQGIRGVNTVAFANGVGAVNVALAFLLLEALARRGWIALGFGDRLWLTALWGVGSVHWYMSTLGSVWFVSQISTVTFMLLAAILAATRRGPFWVGLALMAAMWARPLVVLVFPLLAVSGTLEPVGGWKPSRALRWSLIAAIPLVFGVLALLGYNAARFGDPFDFGYLTQNVAREVAGDLRRYGQFNLHYALKNLWVMFLAGPGTDPKTGAIAPMVEGMSLLLTTPAILIALWARRPRPLVVAAALSVLLLAVPLVLYYNTGWWQFGYRFSLDFMTPLFVLIAIGAGSRVRWPVRALIGFGIAMNAWGVWWFLNPALFG